MLIFALLTSIALQERPISESTLPDNGLHASVPGHDRPQRFASLSNKFHVILDDGLAHRDLMNITITYTFDNIIDNVVSMAAQITLETAMHHFEYFNNLGQ